MHCYCMQHLFSANNNSSQTPNMYLTRSSIGGGGGGGGGRLKLPYMLSSEQFPTCSLHMHETSTVHVPRNISDSLFLCSFILRIFVGPVFLSDAWPKANVLFILMKN